jgi:lysozyme
MIPGFDCYAGYGQIDFNVARAAGYRFVWIKCQEGNNGKDPLYERNVQRTRDAGLVVGAYHFAFPLPTDPKHPNRGPLEQAELYFKACAGLGASPGELSPALDLEWPAQWDPRKFLDGNGNGVRDTGEPLIDQWKRWGIDAAFISEWARECCEAMALLWGRLPIIYTYPHWWRELSRMADTSWAARYPLWYADYSWMQDGHPPEGWSPPKLSWVEDTWPEWAACQHSADGSKARVPGVPVCPVDRNVIRDEETFARLTGRPLWDPDAETQPNEVPVVRPDPIQAKAFVSNFPIVHTTTELIDGVVDEYRRNRGEPDDEPPPAA